jgi:hypothetical protein
MKKRTALCLSLLAHLILSHPASAQLDKTDDVKKSLATENIDTVAWVHGGIINLGGNQGFLHNWAPGGEIASLTLNGLFSGYLNYLHHNRVWSNNLDMAYGLFYAYSNTFVPRKTDDRIDFTSKYGVRIDSSNLYLTGLFNFKSQFTKGFDYTANNWDTFSTSRFFSPAYFTLGLGMEYRKGSTISLFLSPLSARLTFMDKYYTTQSPEGAAGVPYNKTFRFELGAYFSGRYQAALTKTITFQTRLDLYANYLAKNQKDSLGNVVKKDNPGNIDILSDNLITFKAYRFVTVAIGATFIYDNDLPYNKYYTDEHGIQQLKNEPAQGLGWWQVKQMFTIGFQYKF